MFESVAVERGHLLQLNAVSYQISYRTLDGERCTDTQFFSGEQLAFLRPGVVPMHTAVLTRRQGGRIAAMAYLIIDDNSQVVARIKRLPECDREAVFEIEGGLPLAGLGVHPLPIVDRREAKTEPRGVGGQA